MMLPPTGTSNNFFLNRTQSTSNHMYRGELDRMEIAVGYGMGMATTAAASHLLKKSSFNNNVLYYFKMFYH
jgi:hypothetical protein